jgi:hypothetical protein
MFGVKLHSVYAKLFNFPHQTAIKLKITKNTRAKFAPQLKLLIFIQTTFCFILTVNSK